MGHAGGGGRAGADEGERERADHLGDRAAQGVFGHGGKLTKPRRTDPAGRTWSYTAEDAPPGHLLAQPDAVAVADVPCYCKYCAFATHRAHLYSPEEVLEILDGAARRQVKELLVLTGEKPGGQPRGAPRACASTATRTSPRYVVWACERALERGLLPHTNLGVLSREDLARLREVTASQGLMLESVSERLMQTVHAGSPTKHPARRLETIRAAGELRIPFTSGILVGIGETEEERVESLGGARGGARRARPHPGGDPAELRPPPALLRRRSPPRSPTRPRARTGARGDRRRRGPSDRDCRCRSGRAR